MTRAEALRELGVERGANPDEIRRAYLRGVKAHRPEVDPEGFQRLRAAYERLTETVPPQPPPPAPSPSTPPLPSRPEVAAESWNDPEAADPRELLRRAESLIADGETAAAAECARQTLETEGYQRSTADLQEQTLGLILDFLIAGAVLEAREIYDLLGALFTRSGGEATRISPSAIATWNLLGELVLLPDDFPQEVRAALARAVAAADLDAGLPELWRLVRTDSAAAQRVEADLRSLPLLAAAYLSTFQHARAWGAKTPPARPRRARRTRKSLNSLYNSFLITAGILLALALLSQLSALLKPALSPPPDPEDSLPALRLRIDEVCAQHAPTEEESCAWAVAALGFLENRRCAEAEGPVSRLYLSFYYDENKAARLRPIADQLARASAHCP
jgi:hypothetical protein